MFSYYEAVITYKCDGKIYHDTFPCDINLSRKDILGMFQINHAMSGDLELCKVVSIDKFLR